MNATGLGLDIVRVQGNKIIFVTHLLAKSPQKNLQSHEMTFLNNIPVDFGRWVQSWSHTGLPLVIACLIIPVAPSTPPSPSALSPHSHPRPQSQQPSPPPKSTPTPPADHPAHSHLATPSTANAPQSAPLHPGTPCAAAQTPT